MSMKITFTTPDDEIGPMEVDDNLQQHDIQTVAPGDVITEEPGFMRGHGTYSIDERTIATTAGIVERVNKLISVKPLRARYRGEIGDVVVGRITEVVQKKWKVDINGRQDGVLLLSSISLPGGVQRRKTELDELNMRTFFAEGDLICVSLQTNCLVLTR
jgi:exosome complex component RRP4